MCGGQLIFDKEFDTFEIFIDTERNVYVTVVLK